MTNLLPLPQRRAMRLVRPHDRDQLRGWIEGVLGVEAPSSALDVGAASPLDYLCHTFFEPGEGAVGVRDAVVWACRGGGKTFYAALATVLDLIFKPGIQVMVLGGSLDQSQRMYAHLRLFLERGELRGLIEGRVEARRVRLRNGSCAEVLAQSHTSVRGARPQKLRCDEVELFDPEVWEAAQLMTRSARCGGIHVQGSIEALSTMHAPGGLMASLTSEASAPDASRRLFRWGAIDVLEHCPETRDCETCLVFEECQGRAKSRIGGHLRIDDAIAQKKRVSQETWNSEMRCLRPSRKSAVFPEFDPQAHVSDAGRISACAQDVRWLIGMDFGYRAPTAILWAALDTTNVLRVIDERVQRETTLQAHIDLIRAGGPSSLPAPAWIACDPAGHQRSAQTGVSEITWLRRAGHQVKAARLPLARGLEAIRARLAPASGSPTLLIHPRCARLIEAFERYHYPDDRPEDPNPVKDGPDHIIDALRYLVASIDLSRGANVRAYW